MNRCNLMIFKKTSLAWHVTIVIVLALLMMLFNYNFYINELITNTQFIKFNGTEGFIKEALTLVNNNGHSLYYIGFFILDFLWAPLFLLLLYRLLCKYRLIPSIAVNYLLISIGSIALLSDYIENTWYLIQPTYELKTVVKIKIVFYALYIFSFLYLIITANRKMLSTFIRHLRISLFFIAIIIIMITKIEMGGDIVISLFESPLNLFAVLVLIFIIAIPTAHYPVYFKIKEDIKKGNKKYIFCVNHQIINLEDSFIKKVYKWLLLHSPFRIIYYRRKKRDNRENKTSNNDNTARKLDFYFKIFRKSIGVSLIIALIFIFLDNYKTYLDPKLPVISIVFFITLFLILYLRYISILKEDAGNVFNNKKKGFTASNTEEKTINKFRSVVLSFYGLCILSSYFIVLSTCIASFYKWGKISILVSVFTLVILAITFITFSVSRSWFKYVYYNDNANLKSKDGDESYINKEYRKYIRPTPKKLLFLNYLYLLSDNIIYLSLIAGFGIFLVAIFLFLNLNWQYDHHVNFINILLIIYMIYYGAFVLYIKHRMYLKNQQNVVSDREQQNYPDSIKKYIRITSIFWKCTPFVITIGLIIAVYSVVKGNQLHYIQSVERIESQEVTLTSFKDSITNDKKHLFISSYGGGLKSNLWTMLVLDKLENDNDHFLENVRCLSGVSGGGIGFANYMLLDTASNIRSKQINNIATYNFVSLDMTFLLGRDLIQEFLPCTYKGLEGKDRAFYGMKQHLAAMGYDTDSLEEKSFFKAYYERNKKGYFPPLIINTISTKGIQGVSFSIPLDSIHFKTIFPGAINTLDALPTTTLHYLGAVSTTNRFPILSPSASIEGKGHFIDGGAFDNSGMLSTENLKNYLIKAKIISDENNSIYFININVSKDAYIRKFIEKHHLKTQKISASGEVPAIINTASATGGLPRYITQKLKNEQHFYEIILPHTFSFADLEGVLGGELDTIYMSKLDALKAINHSNAVIKDIVNANANNYYPKNLVVQPATGRLMSKPSINYQQIMLNHPSVRKQFIDIKKVLTTSKKTTTQ